MSDERNDEKDKDKDKETPEEPAKQFAEGIGMLFKAAKGAAAGIKKEIDRTNVGKAFEDAGREFARAATNVVEHVSAEISGKKRPGSQPPQPPRQEGVGVTPPHERDDADDFDGVTAKKPTGPTPEDPGFRIAVDDDDEKKSG
jgi:hypothetical protein